nr:diguanylate cyclase [uncultured Lichenicoccus sp.]
MTFIEPGLADFPPREPASGEIRPGNAPIAGLSACMRDSRNRWRALVALGADIAFETDRDGRFVMLSPDIVLGWQAARLIGTPAADLLAQPAGAPLPSLFNPFSVTRQRRKRRVWLRHADGSACCLLLSSEPVGANGCADTPGAVRGIGTDITVQDRYEARLASDLLQQENVWLILARMRDALLPAPSLAIALEELANATDAQGAALLLHDAHAVGAETSGADMVQLAQGGRPWPGTARGLRDLVAKASTDHRPPWSRQVPDVGLSLLLCASGNHFSAVAVLALWREEAGWSETETGLAASVLHAIQPAIEQEQIQRETARQSRTDLLTGLLNRRGFEPAVTRRLDRLDRDGLCGTLMVIGIDGLRHVNGQGGTEAGDATLVGTAGFLNNGVRPSDLVARLGGDMFAIWLDGADQFAAAERAEGLARSGVPMSGNDAACGRIGLSIGLASRPSRSFEGVDSLLRRATGAMRAVKLAGGGRWLVSSEEPMP